MQRATREEWTSRVSRLKESGLSVVAFAAEIGVNSKSLGWWRKRLASPRPSGPPKRALARLREEPTAQPTSVRPLNFVEVTAAIESDGLEVVLPTSVRIRVRRGFDSPTLTRLLDVLDSRP